MEKRVRFQTPKRIIERERDRTSCQKRDGGSFFKGRQKIYNKTKKKKEKRERQRAELYREREESSCHKNCVC
jgi:hypothetical protein